MVKHISEETIQNLTYLCTTYHRNLKFIYEMSTFQLLRYSYNIYDVKCVKRGRRFNIVVVTGDKMQRSVANNHNPIIIIIPAGESTK